MISANFNSKKEIVFETGPQTTQKWCWDKTKTAAIQISVAQPHLRELPSVCLCLHGSACLGTQYNKLN